ncbi:MAG: hypothetical protein JST00_47010 [Deltaproteobacteria bacterium]|nr:hypothetical protein [Deltaproteobacteria bacterium]
MTRLGRLAPFLLVSLAALPAQAGGWQEVHQTSDDVRITVGPDGVAVVQHHLRYRIVAGKFKAFEFAGIDEHAELVGESAVTNEKGGGEIPARIEPNPKAPGSIRIAVDDPPKGLTRGTYTVDVRYRIDLVATKMLVRDGAMWRVAWKAPPSPEGMDGARVVFELPSAPTEPRLASPELAATTLSTIHRETDRDELELVRAHVPRGEAVTWAARVDPKAFPRVVTPELRPPTAAVAPPPVAKHVPIALLASGLALLAGILALVLRAKQTSVARASEAASMQARPLVPVPWGLGPFAYGASVTGALALLLWSTPIWGAVLVVVAMALGAHREPAARPRPRGPGRWMPIADGEVLVKKPAPTQPGDALDASTRKGALVALLVAAALGGIAFALRTRVPGIVVAVPLAGAALVPVFTTGLRAQLPRSPAELAARMLAPARDTLGRLLDLGHVDIRCLARFRERTPVPAKDFDEVRLACTPADRIPGLRTIELAVASPPGARVAFPEVLVRFDDGSAAAAKIAQMLPGVRIVPGRTPEEKVLRLAPRVPTPAGAARLLARLTLDLEGRRRTDRPGDGGTKAPLRRGFVGADRRAPTAMIPAPMPA